LAQDNYPQTPDDVDEALERHRRRIDTVLRLLTLDEVRLLVREIEDKIADRGKVSRGHRMRDLPVAERAIGYLAAPFRPRRVTTPGASFLAAPAIC